MIFTRELSLDVGLVIGSCTGSYKPVRLVTKGESMCVRIYLLLES